MRFKTPFFFSVLLALKLSAFLWNYDIFHCLVFTNSAWGTTWPEHRTANGVTVNYWLVSNTATRWQLKSFSLVVIRKLLCWHQYDIIHSSPFCCLSKECDDHLHFRIRFLCYAQNLTCVIPRGSMFILFGVLATLNAEKIFSLTMQIIERMTFMLIVNA